MEKRVNIYIFILIILCSNLYAESKIARYWEKIRDNIVKCVLCPRKCILKPNQRGVCTVRINKDGNLYTLGYANPVAVHVDPIEKKPLFHVMPGSPAFSIAVAGCNMRCLFCQNWQISQSMPDKVNHYKLSPEQIIQKAKEYNCDWIVYTYTEPTVFYEYMIDIAKLAKQNGMKNAMHSCGYINPKPLNELLNYMDAVNIDLKGFKKEFYQKMGLLAELEPVLNVLKIIKQRGVWLEITNLVIPGANDDPNDIKKMCEWIKNNLGQDTPVHFSRFHPAFKLQNLAPTPIETLEECYKIAHDSGLKYVYIGNVPSCDMESTFCPKCNARLVWRIGYRVKENNIKNNKCSKCGYAVSGIWQ